MDFPYLAKVTKLNVAALAALASAPPPPEPTVEGAVSTDTTVKWKFVDDADHYIIRWRRTDAAYWQSSKLIRFPEGGPTPCGGVVPVNSPDPNAKSEIHCVLPQIRVDDWVFGVSSVSADGYESPVASAVPGGAFKPYVAPVEKK